MELQNKRPVKGIETVILSQLFLSGFLRYKTKDPSRGLRLSSFNREAVRL